MKSRNIGLLKNCLAVACLGVSLVLVGCDGGEADYSAAPDDFGLADTVASGDGFGTAPNVGSIGSADSQETVSVMANGQASVTIPHRTAPAIQLSEQLQVSDGPNEMAAGDEPAMPSNEFTRLFEEIDRKLASLPLANIAFNTPETIPYGDAAVIELLVSLQETEEELRQAIRAQGPIETARVQVSPYLEASLAGVGFRIEPITPSQQLLSSQQRTQWRWNLEPTKAESLELTLTLSAIFTVDGHQSTRAIQTFSRTITVDVPMTHRVSDFVASNKELLLTLLVFPAAAWTYRRYVKRDKTPPSGDNQSDSPAVSRAA